MTQLEQKLREASRAFSAENSASKDLKSWDRAVVRNTGDQGLHCLATASLDARIVYTLEEGTQVTLQRGPARREGYVWWEVEAQDRESCWAAENWLYPLQ